MFPRLNQPQEATMPTIEIPQLNPMPTKNPEPAHPGLESRMGDLPKPLQTTASKKTDDLSRHESRHDMVPKHEPKLNAREKPAGGGQPATIPTPGTKPQPGPKKK
jgi:hypothetical protein